MSIRINSAVYSAVLHVTDSWCCVRDVYLRKASSHNGSAVYHRTLFPHKETWVDTHWVRDPILTHHILDSNTMALFDESLCLIIPTDDTLAEGDSRHGDPSTRYDVITSCREGYCFISVLTCSHKPFCFSEYLWKLIHLCTSWDI